MKENSVCGDVCEQLTRNPIKGMRSDEIKGIEEDESPSKIYPAVPPFNESDHNTNNQRQEKTQPKSGNEKKIETPPKGKVQTQSKSSNVKKIEASPKGTVKQSSPSKTNIGLYCKLGIFLVAIVAIMAAKYYYSDSGVTEPLNANKVVVTLQQQFSGQSNLSFKIIKTSINKIINGTDLTIIQPSIILLMSSKGANETGISFAKELASLISLPQTDYLTIYGNSLKDTNTDKTKKFIDDQIKIACVKQKPAVILLQDLDMLSAFSANILHSYCDHENAPCKEAFFIMTISTEEVIPQSADSKDLDRLAETHLRQSWHHMSNDLLSPLLSRITVSVVGIIADKPSK